MTTKIMIQIALVLCSVLLVNAAPNSLEAKATIKEAEREDYGGGNYYFRFVTSNGITRQESGQIVNAGHPDEHMVVTGFYSYTDADGSFRLINYTADENGYSADPVPLTLDKDLPASGAILASLLGK